MIYVEHNLCSSVKRSTSGRNESRFACVLWAKISDIHGGIFRVTKDLIDEFGADRVRDTPISESSFVGLGIDQPLLDAALPFYYRLQPDRHWLPQIKS